MLAFVGALLLAGAIFYIAYSTQKSVEDAAAKERLGIDLSDDRPSSKLPAYIKLTKPLLKGGTLSLATGFFSPESLDKYRKQIRSAGLHKLMSAEEFVGAKFWLSLMVGVFLFLHYLFSSDPGPGWVPIAVPLLAFFLPNIDLKSTKDSRQLEVRLGMPYVIDLMTLSMEAGLEFQGAVSRVVERAPKGPFVDELAELLKDIQLGKSRAEALRKMANAVDVPEITSLVAILISADQMGSPVGPVLRSQSETMRVERLVKAEKLGAQASQKILFPLVVFILPSVFIIIFGPIILQAIGAN